jgi:hypothetical protein
MHADKGGENQPSVAEGPKHGEALVEGDLAQMMGGGQQAQQHDADEADLAEGGLGRRGVERPTLHSGEELAIERRGRGGDAETCGCEHANIVENICSNVKGRSVQATQKRSDFSGRRDLTPVPFQGREGKLNRSSAPRQDMKPSWERGPCLTPTLPIKEKHRNGEGGMLGAIGEGTSGDTAAFADRDYAEMGGTAE